MNPLTAGLRTIGIRNPLKRSAGGFVGVEAERTQLRVARRQTHGRREAWSVASIPLPIESPEGSKGADRTPRTPTSRVGIQKGPAICAINSPAIDIFPLELRPTESEGIEALVVAHAQKQLGRGLDEVVLDYAPLPEPVMRPGGGTVPVLAFAAPRELVETLLTRIEALGLNVVRILTPACALAPRVARVDPEARHLVIDTALEGTSISVAQHGHVLLERILPWGLRRLAERLGSELDLDEQRCEEILTIGSPSRSISERPEAGEQGADPMEGLMREVLAPAFRELGREAAACLDYCDSVLRHLPATAAVLVGPLGNYPTLRKLLEAELNLPIRRLGEGIDLGGLPEDGQAGGYATAASCALWEEGTLG